MIDLNEDISLFFDEFWKLQGVDNDGESYKKFLIYPTVGIVINTDDPLQMGRVQVFCPAYGDNPKKLLHLPWCAYVSSFGGSIKNSCFTRGAKVGPEKSVGAVHYGFWAIPEQGAHVVVGCLDGDAKRRFYFGSLPEHQETHTLFHGRYKWGEGGIPNGPLTSDGEPIEPAYTNLGEAFNNDRSSREWKTRVADYQVTAVREDIGEIPNDTKEKYLDQQYDKISEAEQDDWVKPILGAHGYDWTGFKGTGAFLSSRVYGFCSPGFHSMSMDDRPFNCRIKIRSASGHQLIMDDTNERIYIMTNKGKSWVEMDSSGNIDIYSEKRISMHAKQDINFTTDETFRVHAKKGIHLYAGNNTSQENLESVPSDGEIRFQAEDDMHLISRKTMRWLSFEDSLFEIGGKKCESIADSLYLQVQNEINTITNFGDYNLTVSNNINEMVNGNVNKYALGSMKNMSNGNAQMHSFDGKMDIGSRKTMNIKSISEDVALEAVGKNTNSSAAVVMKSPQSQYGVTSEGVYTATKKDIVQKAAKKLHLEIEDTPQNPPSDAEDPGPCGLGDGPLPIDGYTGADRAARLAYNAGFRGEDLVTAVAIAGGESGYNLEAINPGDARPTVWGPSMGLFQIRTLQNPSDWPAGSIDRQRDPSIIGGAQNAQNNANLAYRIYNRSHFREWGAFTNGSYKDHLDTAQAAVNNMCSGVPPMQYSPTSQQVFDEIFGNNLTIDRCGTSLLDLFISAETLLSSKPLFTLSVNGVNVQTIEDINFKSIRWGISTKMFDEDMCESIIPTINKIVSQVNGLKQAIGEYMTSVIASAGLGPVLELAAQVTQAIRIMDMLVGFVQNPSLPSLLDLVGITDCNLFPESLNVPNFKIPFFDVDIQTVFDINSHEGCTFPNLDNLLDFKKQTTVVIR
jgi:hypothetical protein